MTEIRSPALFAYVFAAIDGGDVHELGRAWDAARRLGMTDAIHGLAAPPDLREAPRQPVPQFALLAAARRPGDEGQFQAYAFAYHDVAGVVACLAPEQGDASAWSRLLGHWGEASGEAIEALGTALVLVGLAEQGTADAEPPALEGRPWVSGARTESRITVWEAAGEPRTLALIAPPDREAEVDRWAWWAGETRLPALARYLLHSAKLRFEAGVYRSQIGELHTALEELDREIVALTGVLGGEHGRLLTTERLQDAERRLLAAEVRLAGVTGTATSLEDLGRTVRIARHNMTALAPAPARGAPAADSPFARDLETADWLEAQVEHDVGYARSAQERADRVRDLLSIRLANATERRTQEQNYLLLLQTALLSALIAGFAALDVLDLKEQLTLANGIRPPLVALVMSLALALPPLLAHLYARYRWFDRVSAALLGASLGWFLVSGAWLLATSHPQQAAPWWGAIPVAAVFGSGFLALTWPVDRRVNARSRRTNDERT